MWTFATTRLNCAHQNELHGLYAYSNETIKNKTRISYIKNEFLADAAIAAVAAAATVVVVVWLFGQRCCSDRKL